MNQNWQIDPMKGDYVMSGGAPVQTDSLTIPAYIRIKTQRSKWLYAPDANYGSNYALVRKRDNSTASTLETIGADALRPIVDDGRANRIDVTTVAVARHGIGQKIDILDARGRLQTLILPTV